MHNKLLDFSDSLTIALDSYRLNENLLQVARDALSGSYDIEGDNLTFVIDILYFLVDKMTYDNAVFRTYIDAFDEVRRSEAVEINLSEIIEEIESDLEEGEA